MTDKIYLHPGSPMMARYLTDAFAGQPMTSTPDNPAGVLYFPSTGTLDLTAVQAADAIRQDIGRIMEIGHAASNAPWLVFGSSYHVYGLRTGEKITEMESGGIPDDVGRALRHAEASLQNEWPGKLAILRCAPVFGQGPMESWIMRMFDQVMRGLYFNIRDCDARRSMVLAYDVARLAVLLAGEQGVFNVADGFDRTLSTLALAMGNNYGKGKRPFTLPRKYARVAAATTGKLGMIITQEELEFRSTDLTLCTDRLMRHLNAASPTFSFHDTVAVVGRQDDRYPYIHD